APFLPAVLVLIAAVAAIPIVTGNPSLREELFLVLMLVTLASSINIIMGYTGYVSFGHIVFFGIGGYIAFWLMQMFNVHFLLAAIASAIPAALIAALIGIPILRLRGAYFALATVGINEAMKSFMTNFEPFGGAIGMFFSFSIYQQYGGAREAAFLAYYTMPAIALATVATSYVIRCPTLVASPRALRHRRARRVAAQPIPAASGVHPVILDVEGVTVRFGGLVACDAVTFSVDQGQILGLIGPNGAGKTTLFNAINGIHRPRAGRIEFRGDDIT